MSLSQHQMAHRCYGIQLSLANTAKLSRLFILKVCIGFVNHANQGLKFQLGKAQDVAAPRAFDRGFGLNHEEVASKPPRFNSYLAKIFKQEVGA